MAGQAILDNDEDLAESAEQREGTEVSSRGRWCVNISSGDGVL